MKRRIMDSQGDLFIVRMMKAVLRKAEESAANSLAIIESPEYLDKANRTYRTKMERKK